MTEYIVKVENLAKLRKLAGFHVKETLELTSGKIVRCVDCHWANPDQSDHDYRGEYHCNMWIADVSADGFCWRGWRKEGGDD